MKYALGNMLNGAGGLNPDGLALDLQFAADKAYAADGTVVSGTGQFNITSRKGPPAKFTRGSGATRVNELGLIEWTPENLSPNSQNLSAWSRLNSTLGASITSPDGTNNANSVSFQAGSVPTFFSSIYVSTTQSVAAGQIITISVYLKASSNTTINIAINGVAQNSNNQGTTVNVSTTWQRVSATFTVVAADSLFFVIGTGVGGSGMSNLTARTIDIWGAQLERHTSARAYIPTTTAAAYAPRFDHDPVTLASRGLLIEESRTNLLLQSENFGTTWSSVNLNLTGTPPYLNVATAPDGATTADKLIATTSNVTHQFRQDITLVSGTTYTISVYFKAAETNFATIAAFGVANGNADWVSYFDISSSTPAVGAFNGFSSTSLVDVGNGWRRCSSTFTATASGSLSVRIGGASGAAGGSNFYVGDGTSGFLLWGAQLEAGSFATSYIPTTTASVVRSADVCTIANTSPFWNSSEFTLLTNANFVVSGVDAYASNFNITIGFFGVRRPNTNQAIGIIRSSGVSADIPFGANGSFTTGSMRMALAHSTGQQAGSLNGATAIQQNSAFVPSSNPPFNIGFSGTGAYINGYVLAIRYYRKRLPNAKLQALTA